MGKTKQLLTKAESQLTKLIITLDSDLRNENLYIAREFNDDINRLYDLLKKINKIKEDE